VGKLGKMYEPVSLLTALRTAPVAVCVTVTSAPGNRAPLGSATVPLICAVPCAHNGAENPRISPIRMQKLPTRFIVFLHGSVIPAGFCFFGTNYLGDTYTR